MHLVGWCAPSWFVCAFASCLRVSCPGLRFVHLVYGLTTVTSTVLQSMGYSSTTPRQAKAPNPVGCARGREGGREV